MIFLNLLLIFYCCIYFSSALNCFSTVCPGNAPACIEHCPDYYGACHALHLPNKPVHLGCTHAVDCNTTVCNFAPLVTAPNINLTYCCCIGDHCNRAEGFTDLVDPVLQLATSTPPVPVPSRPPGTLICEKYNCTIGGGACYHGYEVCKETSFGGLTDHTAHSCYSSYTVNTKTAKLELFNKGCIFVSLVVDGTPCNSTNECHINNPLVTPNDTSYFFCCCGHSLCNQNDTFTHPTELSIYGLDACNNKGCLHSCVIKNNKAMCLCRDGHALFNDTQCLDINECDINNGGCDEVCINTQGSFMCDCSPGRRMDTLTGVCRDSNGISCLRRQCTSLDTSNCTTSIDHCDEHVDSSDFQFCLSTYIYLYENSSYGIGFVPRTESCYIGAHVDCEVEKCELRLLYNTDYGPLYHCCCNTDLCNLENRIIFPNMSDIVTNKSSVISNPTSSITPTITPTSSTNFSEPIDSSLVHVAISVPIFFVIFVLIAIITGSIVIVSYVLKKRTIDQFPIDTDNRNSLSPILGNNPYFISVIGQGRFAKVCQAKRDNDEVAIKIFNNTLQARDSWNHEKDIYMTEKLEHENILKFIGHEQHFYEGSMTYWLIFDFHPFGSLHDYLQTHNLTVKEFCTLSESAANGLAHLHEETMTDSSLYKPAIAHRDLKSKNILVKQNLTCCISDFGLAMKFKPGEHQINQAKGQVGTSRYMAPEVLEGAISFDQQSFLRIDVYAFGLILWEMASLCDLPSYQVPEYHAPFDRLVSPNPSIDEMKQVVSIEKKRPDIPLVFSKNQMYDIVVETMRESWDPDADARPSAQLIKTRLKSFHNTIDPPPKHVASKESGFASFAFPHSDSYTTPLPPTPTLSSPSITMSPTEVKSHPTNFLVGSLPVYSPSSTSSIKDQMYEGFKRSNNNRPTNILSTSLYSNNSPMVSPQHGVSNMSCSEYGVPYNNTAASNCNETSL